MEDELSEGALLCFEVKPRVVSGLALAFTANGCQYPEGDRADSESEGEYWVGILFIDNLAVEMDCGFSLLT
jgi:hypothetical protein